MPDKKTRNELKAAFAENSLPTAVDFAALIDSGLNQTEDGVNRTAAALEVSCLLSAKAGVDVGAGRTGAAHVVAGKPLYVTGADTAASEFRNLDGSLGVGITPTAVAAAGTNQDLKLRGNGSGVVRAESAVDIAVGARTTGHVVAGKPLYVTGAIQEKLGSEFRSADGSKGIGLGLTTVYAAGAHDLQLAAGSNGSVRATSGLRADATLDVTGAMTAASTVQIAGVLTAKTTVDIGTANRPSSPIHSLAGKPLYVTGNLGDELGVEFRTNDASRGLGFGANTVYAVKSTDNLRLKSGSSGAVEVTTKLKVGAGATVTKFVTTMASDSEDASVVPTRAAIIDRLRTFSGVPIGGIIMWSGSLTAIPTGWALCDGQNGRPNLTDRFVLGYGKRAVGVTGGAETVTLGTSHMPSHNHAVTLTTDGSHSHSFTAYHANFRHEGTASEGSTKDDGDGSFSIGTSTNGAHTHSASSGYTGGNAAHDNMPPYYVLAFIIRVS